MVIETALDRSVRILVVSIGIGSLIFSVLGLGGMLSQHASLAPAFAIATYLVFCGLPPLMAVGAFRLPVPTLRALAGVHAASAVVILALWYPSLDAAAVPSEEVPWIMNIVAVATTTAALALRPAASWAFLFAIAAGSGVLRFAVLGGTDALRAFQDAVSISLFSVVVVALVQLTLRSARQQDAAAAEAQEAASRSGATKTLERQRSRYLDFTRDEVLTVLAAGIVAAEHPDAVGEREREQIAASAATAIGTLDRMRTEMGGPAVMTVAKFESLCRASGLASVAVGVTVSGSGGADLVIPAAVGDALLEAFREALANSEAHATRSDGRPVLRRAVVTITATGIEMTVSDDGRGFSLNRVALDRLGVRSTILRGVRAIPGGSSDVRSKRGSGTTVSLAWTREATA